MKNKIVEVPTIKEPMQPPQGFEKKDPSLLIHARAMKEGLSDRLRFLLYENLITEDDAARLGGLDGILLQSKPDEDGRSKNEFIARYQRLAE